MRLGATTANSTVKAERQSKEADVEIEEEWLNIENEELLVSEKIPELASQIIHQLEEKMATKKAA